MLMLGFMAVMVPLVFVINGVTKGSWGEAFFFAVAVAVGLTPEMLPMIVTICLSKGAVAMGKKQVIVKRINAIQNLGAMDVLCTDKTGTLTRDEIILERHCDVALREDDDVLALAYINSHFQTGLKSVLDRAVLAHEESHAHGRVPELAKVDEIPFDFERRIMSVVVRTPEGNDRIISKGAPEAIFEQVRQLQARREAPADGPPAHRGAEEGVRAAERRRIPRAGPGHQGRPAARGRRRARHALRQGRRVRPDPRGLRRVPRPAEGERARRHQGARAARRQRSRSSRATTSSWHARSASRSGWSSTASSWATRSRSMTDAELAEAAEETVLFARVSPAHKQRIIRALQSREHTVGFMGDGINDAPALHAADVGISVDTAVDIAKESADIILLEKSLLVLDEGVLEGRKVFSNIVKYVRMGASSNFGNMFSVLGASVFVPFLPMRPIQILANNLLYDIGQAAIPTDAVDPERIQKPRTWDLKELTRFILFIGPCSSIFDYSTYFLMLYVFELLGRLHARGRRAQPEPLPDGLVRGEPAHADPHHPRHPHEQDPVPAEPAVGVPDGHERGDHGDRRGAAVHAARPLPRVHRAARRSTGRTSR